ncbi:MAG: 50S ribosomal protein L11 methyltransferase [Candidatus Thorarchaeota archaeon]
MSDKNIATPFSLLHSASLLSQHSRIRKFAAAIERVVNADSYVVDIGAGSGILSLLSAKVGARKTTAVEINKESTLYAKQAARMNGLENKVDFFEGHFQDFIPTEKADVVVCEMLSSMMLIEQQVPAAKHAVKEVLREGGLLLPHKITIYSSLVQCDSVWNRFSVEELDFPRKPQTVSRDEIIELSDLSILSKIDLLKIPDDFKIDVAIDYEIVEDGTLHGIVGMFEAELAEDIILNMEDGWRELFLPLNQSLQVSINDVISLRVKYVPGELHSLSLHVEKRFEQ